jgi:hypothetical protein
VTTVPTLNNQTKENGISKLQGGWVIEGLVAELVFYVLHTALNCLIIAVKVKNNLAI